MPNATQTPSLPPTAEVLLNRYGPLLSINDLASLLQRSREGLRLTLRGSSPLAQQLGTARVKIGRRVHFKTLAVAAVIDGASAPADVRPER